MRISDWSSDVCSSDLNGKYLVGTGNDDDTFDTDSGFRGGIQFGLVVQRAGGGDRMNEMSSQDLPYRSMPNLANVTFVGAGHDNAIVLNQGTVVGYYNAVFTGGLPACVEFQSATTEGTFRSEEHTSALQSLMRISYAVFCLKKKKSLIT